MKIIKVMLLVLFITTLMGCSGATVSNKYDKEGPNRKYKGAEDYKRQSIKIIIPEGKEKVEEEKGTTIIINDDNNKNEGKTMTIEKISNDKYIIRVK